MSTMSYGLAEVYVMRKLQKDKMSKTGARVKKELTREDAVDYKKKNVDSGCFSMVLKKIHPNINSSSE
ncbi:hypothetical protein DCAR_0521301 [Daucus carota subsp. sativus]|uniref:Uncharacterized protein n=1 Tax=Daucus carota subsp. sativus TaxID=79200 RepID=A0A164Z5N3_DAUCS|nr:hypothetical protein DCAR_0521301 [Daucus carota subsp. sativus]